MTRRASITLALASAVLVVAGAGGAAASTAPSDPAAQARADAAIAAFDAVATEAGYPNDGVTSTGADLIGLSADSIGSDEASACLAEAATHVEADGSFIGQVATAGSATYGSAGSIAVTDAPATVGPSGFNRAGATTAPQDETYVDLEASAAIVDKASAGELVSLAEALADEALTGCFEDAFRSVGEEQGVEFSQLDTSAESLDIGDASAMIEIVVEAEFDGAPVSFTSILGVAVADDAIAVVSYSVDNGEADDAVVTDGLEAMIGAVSAG